MPRPQLNRSQIGRLKRLLDMQYKVAELAQELRVSSDAIYRSYIPAGAPVTLDDKDRVWINGQAFREWVHQNLPSRRSGKTSMREDMAYCLRCNSTVQIKGAKIEPYKRGVRQMSGTCPNCKGKVNRFIVAQGGEGDQPAKLSGR